MLCLTAKQTEKERLTTAAAALRDSGGNFFQKPLDFYVATAYYYCSNQKGGDTVAARRGRPVSDNPKDFMLRVRLDQETLEQLDECCEAEQLSRSEIVRKGIKEQHGRIKK